MDNEQLIETLVVELRSGFQAVTEVIGETNARLDQTVVRLDQTNARLDQTNARLEQVAANVVQTNAKLDKLDGKVDRGFKGLGKYLLALEKHHDERISRLEQREKPD